MAGTGKNPGNHALFRPPVGQDHGEYVPANFVPPATETQWTHDRTGQPVYFSTDVCENAKYQGGHYAKVMNVPLSGFQEAINLIVDKVSPSPSSVFVDLVLTLTL